jgi:hypothetical protein
MFIVMYIFFFMSMLMSIFKFMFKLHEREITRTWTIKSLIRNNVGLRFHESDIVHRGYRTEC